MGRWLPPTMPKRGACDFLGKKEDEKVRRRKRINFS